LAVFTFLEEDISKCAADPMKNREWTEATHPWQFLAFCFEWARFKRDGFGVVSSLPIALDGTCNGLQHYAAMLRDENSGKAVNLTLPASTGFVTSRCDPDSDEDLEFEVEPPQDIYQHVADRVAARISEGDYCAWFASTYRVKRLSQIEKMKNPDDRLRARVGLDQASISAPDDAKRLQDLARSPEPNRERQINRRMLKSPVMTLVYGATEYRRRKMLKTYLTDGTESTKSEPLWPNVPWSVVAYLGDIVRAEIHEAVPAAVKAMDWLREVAKLLRKEGLGISWVTPARFNVGQKYLNLERKNIETRLNGRPLKLTIMTDRVRKDKPIKWKQVSALAPNFIHSMDACALAETVLLAASPAGGAITSFAMIHDSYGTTAAQTEQLGKALRTSFVRMYQEHAPLTELRERIATIHPNLAKDLPPVPPIGTLNLVDVLSAPYFFN
jgi:DNA-directed RNA polymerase, mitochondrial